MLPILHVYLGTKKPNHSGVNPIKLFGINYINNYVIHGNSLLAGFAFDVIAL